MQISPLNAALMINNIHYMASSNSNVIITTNKDASAEFPCSESS